MLTFLTSIYQPYINTLTVSIYSKSIGIDKLLFLPTTSTSKEHSYFGMIRQKGHLCLRPASDS